MKESRKILATMLFAGLGVSARYLSTWIRRSPENRLRARTYSFILSSFRYSVFRSMPRICAALLLFPPVAVSTRRI